MEEDLTRIPALRRWGVGSVRRVSPEPWNQWTLMNLIILISIDRYSRHRGTAALRHCGIQHE